MFIYSTFFFSVLLIVANNKRPSFWSLWDDAWRLNFEVNLQENEYSSKFWLNYLSIFLASLVNIILMLNLLIAILGDSFDRFQVDKNFIDYKEKLNLCIEIQKTFALKRTFGRFKYFQVVTESYENEEEQWESRISFLEKKNQVRGERLKKVVVECMESAHHAFQGKIDGVRTRVEGVEKNILTMSDRIGGLEDGMKKVLEILERKK
jgi:hypothetical protein